MTDEYVKKCPKCGQPLRFPKNVGGVVMACPNCGKQFHSDFKLGNRVRKRQKNLLLLIFELPSTLLETIGRRIKR